VKSEHKVLVRCEALCFAETLRLQLYMIHSLVVVTQPSKYWQVGLGPSLQRERKPFAIQTEFNHFYFPQLRFYTTFS